MIPAIGVCIVAYNQQSFIGECIESVLNQQSDYRIVMFIGDDCSTDGTYSVCQRYRDLNPDLIQLMRNERNLGLVANTMNVLQRIQRAGCDYVAFLDGDDYWTDPLKIRKQVSFLENNPGYGLVHTRIKNEKARRDVPDGDVAGIILDYLEKYMRNCTVLFRSELLNYINFQEISSRGFLVCDWIIYTIFSKHKAWFKYFDDETACWRSGHESVSNPASFAKAVQYQENGLLQWRYLAELFPEDFRDVERNAAAYMYFKMFDLAFQFNQFSIAHQLAENFHAYEEHNKSLTFRMKRNAAQTKPAFYIFRAMKKIIKSSESAYFKCSVFVLQTFGSAYQYWQNISRQS
ncbi:MAG: glycosyltransferase [Bacteroidetes bacterium]|nr:glycosyltransferase [Bacteroidota bacterium]